MTEEQEISDLMREKAGNASWDLSAGDIRSQRQRRGVEVPIAKILVSVVAVAVVIVVVVLAGTNVGSGDHTSHPVAIPPLPTTTITNSPVTGPTDPLGCLDPRATTPEPPGRWLPNKGGVLDYNPDSVHSTMVVRPSNQARLMATRFAAMSGHHFAVEDAKAARASHCVTVEWALLHDKAEDSAYMALLQLRRPIDPDSFPLLGATTNRRRLQNGTEVLSSQTSDDGVVTVVATRSDGLTLLLQIRRAGDEEGTGYPTTVLLGPGANSAGRAPISESKTVKIGRTVLSKMDDKQ